LGSTGSEQTEQAKKFFKEKEEMLERMEKEKLGIVDVPQQEQVQEEENTKEWKKDSEQKKKKKKVQYEIVSSLQSNEEKPQVFI